MPHAGHLRAHAIDEIEVIRVDAEHFRAAVAHHVDEVLCGEPVVHRHDHGAPLRDRIELLEMLMRVRRDRRDPVALTYPELAQSRAPCVAALQNSA